MSTKKYLYIVLAVLIGFVGFVLYWSGKSHIEVAVAAQELQQDNTQLHQSVDSLGNTIVVYKHKYAITDSVIAEKDKTISTQKKSIFGLLADAATKVFARQSVVYIHDTIYITEKKNFWGKTKRNVEMSVASIDSSSSLIEQEPILLGSQVAPVDTTKK